MNLSETIGRFVTEKSLAEVPDAARKQAKMAILDWFAALLLAVVEDKDSLEPVLRVVKHLGGKRVASVIGSGMKTTAPWAALVNGYTGHILDYDETSPAVRSHLTSVVLPATLAFAEEKACSGKEILESYVLGYEVALRTGEVMTPGWMQEGWHGTSIFGIFGAVAACGKIAGHQPDKIANALGTACSMASGIAANFGTMTKPFHAGHAAKNAILANMLSEEGFTSGKGAMEGFFHAYSWSSPAKPESFRKLGNPWALEIPGTINPKLYPCCHGLATTIEYGIIFKEKYGLTADQIVDVEIYAPPKALSAMHSRRYADTGGDLIWDYEGPPKQLAPGIPDTGKEAKFSKEYGFAASLLYGPLKSDHFKDEAARNPDVQALMKKIRVYHDTDLDKFSYQYPEADWPYGEKYVVRLKDGTILREEEMFVLGAARRPLSMEYVIKKFRDCAETAGFSSKRTDSIIGLVEDLEKLQNLSQLLTQLRVKH